jgi:Spy/CpxP family protein refolding chaperone
MNKTVLSTSLALTAFVLLTGFHGGCGKDTPEARAAKVNRMVTAKVDDFMDDLDATDAQRKRVQAMKDDVLKDAMPMFEAHKVAKNELRAEWTKDTPDATRVHAILDERIDGARALIHKVADGVIELHQMLTPKQRSEITKMWHD